jgi:hypothetical protein
MVSPRREQASRDAGVGGRYFRLVNWKFKHCKALGIRKDLGYGTIGLVSKCKIQLHNNPAHHVTIR